MHPLLFDCVPLYVAMWLCAATVGVAAGTRVAVRVGFPAGRSAIVITVLAFLILLGSKVLYLAEAHWFPFDDYVPSQLRGSVHGFRIPGGVLSLAVGMPIVCRLAGFSWLRFGDVIIPLGAVAVVLIRLGCFLNGCCFGKVSALPWAFAFPRGSWAFGYHRARGWIPPNADVSLPVHPLQLYFLLSALLILVVLLRQRRGTLYPGYVQLVFYTLFFASTSVLEPLRENYLTLNNWLSPACALAASGVLIGRMLAVREMPKTIAGATR